MSSQAFDGSTRRLWSPQAQSELQRVVRSAPLLAFDFDGTLAPIVARPKDAKVPVSTSRRLQVLSARLKTAVITGRAVDDVMPRLGFTPWQVIGSHGAEDPLDAGTADLSRALETVRGQLAKCDSALRQAGVTVEDKGLSIALHYRLARDRVHAKQAIEQALVGIGERAVITHGKMVVNVVHRLARDKAAALRVLMTRAGSCCAIFVGDDVNDAPVFEADEPNWLTIGVGNSACANVARYVLEGPSSMPRLLDLILASLDGQ